MSSSVPLPPIGTVEDDLDILEKAEGDPSQTDGMTVNTGKGTMTSKGTKGTQQSRASSGDPEMPEPGFVTTVNDLRDYPGEDIYEKLDSFIKEHPVALVNRSWCIFSIDAIDFLSRMGVNVHSLEVDNHPNEAALVKYLKKKVSHDT